MKTEATVDQQTHPPSSENPPSHQQHQQHQQPREIGAAKLYLGDCRDVMRTMQADSVDSVITDPPYGLKFMGKDWDHGVPGVPYWAAALRVAKPGAYMLAFGGARTYHRLACAIEDAGWEIRDCLMWMYGTGFPKAKSCLKPAYEPIMLARKPGSKVLPLNIDGCRIEVVKPLLRAIDSENRNNPILHTRSATSVGETTEGRWPANVLLDEEAAALLDEASGVLTSGTGAIRNVSGTGYRPNAYGKESRGAGTPCVEYGDSGGASRFFYVSKANRKERGEGNNHPTVKPLKLMKYLCSLIETRPGGTAFDPFVGSGTTGIAVMSTGAPFIGIELKPEYYDIACNRILKASQGKGGKWASPWTSPAASNQRTSPSLLTRPAEPTFTTSAQPQSGRSWACISHLDR